MIVRDGLPPTPEWQPEPRPVVDLSRHVDPPAHEAMPWTWASDGGDDG